MANNLVKKVLQRVGFISALAIGTISYGCTPTGAVLMGSDDPAARLIGTFMHYEGAHEEKMKEAREGRSQVNVYNNSNQGNQNRLSENVIHNDGKYNPAPGYDWINPNDPNDLRVIPRGVIFSNNAYNPAPGYAWVNPDNQKDLRVKIKQNPTQIITFNKYVDLNNDGKFQKEEFFGLGKKVFDLNKEELNLVTIKKGYSGKFVFRSWTDSGKLLGETQQQYSPNRVPLFRTGPGYPNQGDFLDNLKGAGPGNYKITVNGDNGQVQVLDIKIISEKKFNSSLDENIIEKDLRE